MNFKEFDYEFDLNGYIILKNNINKKRINKINKILQSLEGKKPADLPPNIFFGKKKTNPKLIYLIFLRQIKNLKN